MPRLKAPGAWSLKSARVYRRTLTSTGNIAMSLGTILLIVLILLLLGAIPTWPHSQSWGYAPSGSIGTVAIVVLILVLMGRI